jgi:hypothetical protein
MVEREPRWQKAGGTEAADVSARTMKKAKAPKASPFRKFPPGPEPDTLKIEGKWQDAVKKSLTKEKPAERWPE